MFQNQLIRFSSVTFDSEITSNLKELQEEKNFCDVTIICEDHQIEAHKAVLAGGSSIFGNIFKQNPHPHPFIFLSYTKFSHLLKLLDFLYRGEVNIDQRELHSFLSLCSDLNVKGLIEDSMKKLKESTCFLSQENNRKKQQFFNNPNQNVNEDTQNVVLEIKVEIDDLSYEPKIQNYDQDCKTEKICFSNQENNKKKPRFFNNTNQNVNEDTHDVVKDSKKQEQDTCKGSQSMVMIPSEVLEIKTEIDNVSYEPKSQSYAEDSKTEKIEEKNPIEKCINIVGENIDQSILRIRDIAKLSENTFQPQAVSTENTLPAMQGSKDYLRKLTPTPHTTPIHDKVSYPCTKCDYASTSKSNLKAHIGAIHDGVTYACNKCDYTTKWKQSLNGHMYSVHGGVPYRCTKCKYSATDKCSLKEHIETAHIRDPYACNKCFYIAKRKNDLNYHMKAIHGAGGVTYTCDKCDFTTKVESNLKKHNYSTHNSKITGYHGVLYSCKLCDHKATKKSQLTNHVKMCHKTFKMCNEST